MVCTYIHTPMMHGGEFVVQSLAQGHVASRAGGAGDRTADLLVPTVSTDQQLMFKEIWRN